MKILITALLGLIINAVQAQLPTADIINTAKGNVTVQPVFHAAMILSYNNKTIYVDPYHGADAYKNMKLPDLILITDIHGDHLDMATLNGLDLSHATLIVPQAVADKLPAEWKSKIIVLSNGSTIEQSGISITAIPMYNLPNDSTAKHPKGRGNGYVLNLSDKKFYISGDTEDIPEMRSLEDIDVAFICMNLPYTMSSEQAASAVLAFKPKIVYPYHYRTSEGFSDIEKFKSLVNTGNPSLDVRLRDWYMGNR